MLKTLTITDKQSVKGTRASCKDFIFICLFYLDFVCLFFNRVSTHLFFCFLSGMSALLSAFFFFFLSKIKCVSFPCVTYVNRPDYMSLSARNNRFETA